MLKLKDRKFRLPRHWSNNELRKFAYLFTGDVVNVSSWKDEDKEGGFYRSYFKEAKSYTTTNREGHMGEGGGIPLDLEASLPTELQNRFDVVFNHTTLEHIFNTTAAFANLCRMSRDIVILVVPFLQEHHGFINEAEFGDYWRYTPHTLKRLFDQNGLAPLYISANDCRNASIYLFAVASRHPERWPIIRGDSIPERIGRKAVRNGLLFRVLSKMRLFARR